MAKDFTVSFPPRKLYFVDRNGKRLFEMDFDHRNAEYIRYGLMIAGVTLIEVLRSTPEEEVWHISRP